MRNLKQLITLIVLLCFNLLNAQNFLSKQWSIDNGMLDALNPYIEKFILPQSVVDNQGNIITASYENNGGNSTDITITKLDKEGNQVWKTFFNSSGSQADFPSAIELDANQNIYICGTAQINNLNFDYLTAKFNPNGTLIWSKYLNGLGNSIDVATSCVIDDSGNVYVTGASTGATSQLDYCTIKYDNAGNQIWQSIYDFANSYEAPAALVINNNGNLYITGGSGTSVSNWDFATIELSPSGTLLNVNRVVNNTGLDKPEAIKKDNQGNIYIVGSSWNQSTNSYDFVTVKYNAQLVLQWQQKLDADGKDDKANSIDIDNNGNVFVAGYTTKSITGKNFAMVKYDSQGNQIWNIENTAENENGDEEIKKIQLDYLGNVAFVGEKTLQNEKEINVSYYNSLGKQLTSYEFKRLGEDNATDFYLKNGKDIYLTTKQRNLANEKVKIVKMNFDSVKENTEFDSNYNPYLKDQLLIRFNPAELNVDFLNDKEAISAPLGKILSSALVARIKTKIPDYDFSEIKAFKLFPELTPADSISIARNGKEIKTPAFWSNFLVTFPEKASRNATDLAAELNKMTFDIYKASPNYLGYVLSTNPNDGLFQNTKQKALCDATKGINACDAWNNNIPYQGSADVKIGHYDTGIKTNHPDFMFNGSSRIVQGLDYNQGNNFDISNDPNNDVKGHGTECASIYGAVSNNNSVANNSIAGVAGGDFIAGTEGVSIYNMKVLNDAGGFSASISKLFVAYVQGAFLSHPANPNPFGFGLYITNHSYAMPDDQYGYIRDGIRFCYRNGITTVAGSGNDNSTTKFYPASLYDEWVMKIGGHDENGNRWVNAPNGSTYGNDLDLVAPSSNTFNNFISYCDNTGGYNNSDEGTSFAAPFVTGSAALIFGYIKNKYPAMQFTDPQDIERMLELYAKDALPSHAYSNTLGWGKLNIGATMAALAYPKYKIQHLGASTEFNTPVKIASDVQLTLKYSHETNPNGTWIILPKEDNTGSAITYTVDVYKYTVNHPHNLGLNTNGVITNQYHAWVTNNNSTLWGEYDNVTNEITPETDVVMTSVDDNSATLVGYTYNFKSATYPANFQSQWYPININIPADIGALTYSIHTNDNSINGINDEDQVSSLFEVFPNPSNNIIKVKIFDDIQNLEKITIIDCLGRVVFSKPKFQINSSNNIFEINTSLFANGIYNMQIESSNHSTKSKNFSIIH